MEGGDGSFTVVADHDFAATGSLPVSVDIIERFGATPEADASGTATVADAAMTMTGGFQLGALAGQSTSLTLAYFTDGSFRAEASDFTATIAWGDGSTSTATVTSAGPGLFEVTGRHSYCARLDCKPRPSPSPTRPGFRNRPPARLKWAIFTPA